jgi:hypothetical protein
MIMVAFCLSKYDLYKLYLKLATEVFFLMSISMLFHSIEYLAVKVRPPSVFLVNLGGHTKFVFEYRVSL